METFINPKGKVIQLYDCTVITYGLNDEQNLFVQANLPSLRYEMYFAHSPTDIIAIPATAVIIAASNLTDDGFEMLMD